MTFLDATPDEFARHDMEADAEQERAAEEPCACGHARRLHVSRSEGFSSEFCFATTALVTVCPCDDFDPA